MQYPPNVYGVAKEKYDSNEFIRLYALGLRAKEMLEMPERTYSSYQRELRRQGNLGRKKGSGRPKVAKDRQVH